MQLRNVKAQKTLLEKILERRTSRSPNQTMSRELIEEGEVLVHWVLGKLNTDEARDALGVKSNGQIHSKAGTSLRNLATGGYISIIWNPYLSDQSPNEPAEGNDPK